MISWFPNTTVLVDAENDFKHLELHVLDGQFFWGVELNALDTCLWSDIIALDDKDLNYYVPADARKFLLVVDVPKGIMAVGGGTVVE